MSAIIKNFTIKLTQRQAGHIRKQFQLACKAAGANKAAMIAQPKTQWSAVPIVNLKPPILDCAVITPELFEAISAVIVSHRTSNEKKAENTTRKL